MIDNDMDGGVIGRADDITKVKGVLLAPTAIEEVVRGFPEVEDEYEVVVTKKGEIDDTLLRGLSESLKGFYT